VGLVVLAVLLAGALLAPWLAPFDPNDQDVARRLTPPFRPGSPFLLGTDHVGRDVLSRLIHGARIAWLIGAAAVLFSGAVGVTLGLLTGYYGGLLDDLIGWLGNVELAFPFILLAVVVAAALGAGLAKLILVLAVVSWVVYARVVRAETLVQREQEFVQAARALGASNTRLVMKHVMPNLLGPCIVTVTLRIPGFIGTEAFLSFIGLGVDPPTPSWGMMISEGTRVMRAYPHQAIYPGLALALVMLAFNFLGDGLRDAVDPRLKQ
jgi:peptide/nickel transport system permease protein